MPKLLNETKPQPDYHEPPVVERPKQGAATERKAWSSSVGVKANGEAPRDRGNRAV